jgi:hypothetical protein
MTIEFELVIDDLINFNLFHMAHSPSSQRVLLLNRLLVSILIIPCSLGVIYLKWHVLTPFAFIVSFLVSAIMFFIFPNIHKTFVVNRIQKMLVEGDNSTVFGHQAITVTPEYILTKTDLTESKLNWSSIVKVIDNDNYVFLYVSATSAIVIPQKAFSTSTTKQQFLDYVRTYMKKG